MIVLPARRRVEYQPKHALPRGGVRHLYQPKHAAPRSGERSTLLVLLALLLSSGLVVSTSASFNASVTDDASQFAMAALDRPSNLTGEMAGTGASLAWFGVTGPSNEDAGYNVLWADAGAPTAAGESPTCVGVTGYTKIDATGSASYTDATANTRAQSPPGTDRPGRFVCYQVETVYPFPPSADPWVSQGANPVKDVQVGFVAAKVAMANVGTNFTMSTGDVITITFNQPVATSSGPADGTTAAEGAAPRICSIPTNGAEFILIGAMGQHNDTCSTSETVLVGQLTPSADRINRTSRWTTTWAWSSCPFAGQCRVLTATLGDKLNAQPAPTLGSHTAWTFTPVATLLSATGSQAMCTTDVTGGLCQPQTTGGW